VGVVLLALVLGSGAGYFYWKMSAPKVTSSSAPIIAPVATGEDAARTLTLSGVRLVWSVRDGAV
jgi:hypothetical protein